MTEKEQDAQLELIRTTAPDVAHDDAESSAHLVLPVHNHGPDQGKGIACKEYRLFGRLVGECMLDRHDKLMQEYRDRQRLEDINGERS